MFVIFNPCLLIYWLIFMFSFLVIFMITLFIYFHVYLFSILMYLFKCMFINIFSYLVLFNPCLFIYCNACLLIYLISWLFGYFFLVYLFIFNSCLLIFNPYLFIYLLVGFCLCLGVVFAYVKLCINIHYCSPQGVYIVLKKPVNIYPLKSKLLITNLSLSL